MRACHAAGPGSIPGGTGFLGEIFRGFPSPVTQMQDVLDPKFPEYHLAIIIIDNYNHSLRTPMS